MSTPFTQSSVGESASAGSDSRTSKKVRAQKTPRNCRFIFFMMNSFLFGLPQEEGRGRQIPVCRKGGPPYAMSLFVFAAPGAAGPKSVCCRCGFVTGFYYNLWLLSPLLLLPFWHGSFWNLKNSILI